MSNRPTKPLSVDEWRGSGGPNYRDVFAWRLRQLQAMRAYPPLVRGALEYYRTRPVEFICDWMTTFDPRNAGRGGKLTTMPFVLFQRQAEHIEFLEWCRTTETNGIIPKSRDMGATWDSCAYCVWLWRFVDGATVGWGSRKEQLVDKLGVIDSIFEKMRSIIRYLPPEFLPKGYDEKKHATYMRITNPENGNVITGEAGANIGRGGRNLMYFKDESAHYEHPEKIEAALSENTRVQIDISSIPTFGTLFQRRHENAIEWNSQSRVDFPKGKVAAFVMSWRDHPLKTLEWYKATESRYRSEGLLHIFRTEVDMDYSASVTNNVIPMEWINSAIDAHITLAPLVGDMMSGGYVAGQDIADGASAGADLNAYAGRIGVTLVDMDEWQAPDTAVTARRAVGHLRRVAERLGLVAAGPDITPVLPHGGLPAIGMLELDYDSVGVGSGFKAEINRLKGEPGALPPMLKIKPWNAGAPVQRPFQRIIPTDKESPLRKDVYKNMKAGAWFDLRTRFFKTHRAVTEGIKFPADELISISSKLPFLESLKKELAQVLYGYSSDMKIVIEKTPEETKSPNKADAVVQCFNPVPDNTGKPVVATQSGH